MVQVFTHLKQMYVSQERGKYKHLEWWTKLLSFTPTQLSDALLKAKGFEV